MKIWSPIAPAYHHYWPHCRIIAGKDFRELYRVNGNGAILHL